MSPDTERARDLTETALAAVVLLGLALTAVSAVDDRIRFVVELPGLHMVVDTLIATASAAIAYVLYGRFLTSRDRDLILPIVGFGVNAVGNFVLSTLPHSFTDHPEDRITSWAPTFCRLTLAILLTAFAVRPKVRVLRRLHSGVQIVGAIVAMVAATVVFVWALGDRLPEPLDPALTPSSSNRPFAAGHPLATAALVLGLVLYGVAAGALAVRHRRTDDRLMLWLAASSALSAVAWVNYVLYPSIYTHYFFLGDAFRLASAAVLLGGVVREVRAAWDDVARVAVSEERRRMARDLHDGIAQELALISASLHGRAATTHPELAAVARAADRALDESRLAILALNLSPEESLGVALGRAVDDIAHRTGATVELRVDDDLTSPNDVRDVLVRVTRECCTNAVRHGRAEVVRVEARQADGFRLTIVDAGAGFDPQKVQGGFGLVMMRERVASIGGAMTVESQPGSGTRVEVTVPLDRAPGR